MIFGVISMGDPAPETPETVAGRIRAALAHLPPERLIPASDCGMKYIPRGTASAKLKALAEGAAIVLREPQVSVFTAGRITNPSLVRRCRGKFRAGGALRTSAAQSGMLRQFGERPLDHIFRRIE